MSLSDLLAPMLVLIAGTAGAAFAAPPAEPPAAPSAAQPAAPSTAPPMATSLPSLTLPDLLSQVENRLIDVRRIELRRAEAQAELDHLRVSRAFEVQVEGNYREEDVDRVEVNDGRLKRGRSVDIRRGLTFSLTRPLLGRSLEDRLLAASEQHRLTELAEAELIARREGVLQVIGLYVDLAAEQRHLPLLQRAIELENQKVRILEARREQGESLRLDLLEATADHAARQAEAATAARRQAELFAELGEWVDGEPPREFLAADLDWSRMIEAPAGSGDPAAAPALGESGRGGAGSSGIWYNLPEIDLTFFYNLGSRDRRFTDELDRERGHTPGVELTLEFPLDLWRSERSLARQVEARAERQRLALLALNRRTGGRAREVALAHGEAVARVAAAEADLALREEELRVTRLRATDMADSTTITTTTSSELEGIRAEVALIKTRMALARARGDLARRYFERAMMNGADPKQLALGLNPATAVADIRRPPPVRAVGGGL